MKKDSGLCFFLATFACFAVRKPFCNRVICEIRPFAAFAFQNGEFGKLFCEGHKVPVWIFVCKPKSKIRWSGVLKSARLLSVLYTNTRRNNMKRLIFNILSAALLLSTVFFAGSTPATAKELKILEFDTMVGVPSGLAGTQSPGKRYSPAADQRPAKSAHRG